PSPQLGGAGGGLLFLILLLIYTFIDPTEASWLPRCPLYALTHIQCPFCGAQRMAHSLLTGDLTAAFHHNAALLLALPYILFLIFAPLISPRLRRITSPLLSSRALIIYVLLSLLWMLLRNIL
ncbi:MAG: DUF2752 domain-containing protein, partial [Bacteroidaceae bacterium]|nr:DUF2752 domain-containing protein [Bacteroidaceae bacterium]